MSRPPVKREIKVEDGDDEVQVVDAPPNKRARISQGDEPGSAKAPVEVDPTVPMNLGRAQYTMKFSSPENVQTLYDCMKKDPKLRAVMEAWVAARDFSVSDSISPPKPHLPLSPDKPEELKAQLLFLLINEATQLNAITTVNKVADDTPVLQRQVCKTYFEALLESAYKLVPLGTKDLKGAVTELDRFVREDWVARGDLINSPRAEFCASCCVFVVLVDILSLERRHNIDGVVKLMTCLVEWDKLLAGIAFETLEVENLEKIKATLESQLLHPRRRLPESLQNSFFPTTISMIEAWISKNTSERPLPAEDL